MRDAGLGLSSATGCLIAKPCSRYGAQFPRSPWCSTARPAGCCSERSTRDAGLGLSSATGCLVAKPCSRYGAGSAPLSSAAAVAASSAVADLASSAFYCSCYSDPLPGRPIGSLSSKPIQKIISYLYASWLVSSWNWILLDTLPGQYLLGST